MAKSDKILVGILTGSPSDLPTVEKAKNTAFLAARILSIKYPEIGEKLVEARAEARRRYEQSLT